MANEAKFDAEDFDFQNALPTGNKFIMNSSSTGPPVVQGGVINLLNVSPDGNTVTLLNSVLATAIQVPYSSGFRKIPNTVAIMWVPFDRSTREILFVEYVSPSGTLSAVATLTGYAPPDTQTTVSDVRGYMENNTLRYLIVVYKSYAAPWISPALPGATASARIRIYRNNLVAASPVVLPLTLGNTCSGQFIDGCMTCNPAGPLCDTCFEKQGNTQNLISSNFFRNHR